MKKFLALVLACCMVLAFAATASRTDSGTNPDSDSYTEAYTETDS